MFWVKNSFIAVTGQPWDSGSECWLCDFCAFSRAAKKHGVFLKKTLRFKKYSNIWGISVGVGAVSTAEFFHGDHPCFSPSEAGIRRYTLQDSLPSHPVPSGFPQGIPGSHKETSFVYVCLPSSHHERQCRKHNEETIIRTFIVVLAHVRLIVSHHIPDII